MQKKCHLLSLLLRFRQCIQETAVVRCYTLNVVSPHMFWHFIDIFTDRLAEKVQVPSMVYSLGPGFPCLEVNFKPYLFWFDLLCSQRCKKLKWKMWMFEFCCLGENSKLLTGRHCPVTWRWWEGNNKIDDKIQSLYFSQSIHTWLHEEWHIQVSHVMRKRVYAICEQQRRRSACADQHLRWSLPR